ncbi:MAG: hypothetical protein ABIA04_00180 [Pseudomonadota bacterium]
MKRYIIIFSIICLSTAMLNSCAKKDRKEVTPAIEDEILNGSGFGGIITGVEDAEISLTECLTTAYSTCGEDFECLDTERMACWSDTWGSLVDAICADDLYSAIYVDLCDAAAEFGVCSEEFIELLSGVDNGYGESMADSDDDNVYDVIEEYYGTDPEDAASIPETDRYEEMQEQYTAGFGTALACIATCDCTGAEDPLFDESACLANCEQEGEGVQAGHFDLHEDYTWKSSCWNYDTETAHDQKDCDGDTEAMFDMFDNIETEPVTSYSHAQANTNIFIHDDEEAAEENVLYNSVIQGIAIETHGTENAGNDTTDHDSRDIQCVHVRYVIIESDGTFGSTGIIYRGADSGDQDSYGNDMNGSGEYETEERGCTLVGNSDETWDDSEGNAGPETFIDKSEAPSASSTKIVTGFRARSGNGGGAQAEDTQDNAAIGLIKLHRKTVLDNPVNSFLDNSFTQYYIGTDSSGGKWPESRDVEVTPQDIEMDILAKGLAQGSSFDFAIIGMGFEGKEDGARAHIDFYLQYREMSFIEEQADDSEDEEPSEPEA